MAQPPYQGQYPPPPPQGHYPPPQAQYAQPQVNVVVQQRAVPQKGLLGGLVDDLSRAGKSLEKTIDNVATGVSDAGGVTDNIRTGNVVQLISRTTGRTLQIVQAPNGQLVVDGLGNEGPQAHNALWTCTRHANFTCQFQNYNNYLAIENGYAVIKSYPVGVPIGDETKFQMHVHHGQFIRLENIKERRRHIGIIPTGQLKSATATGTENDSHFGVRLISGKKFS